MVYRGQHKCEERLAGRSDDRLPDTRILESSLAKLRGVARVAKPADTRVPHFASMARVARGSAERRPHICASLERPPGAAHVQFEVTSIGTSGHGAARAQVRSPLEMPSTPGQHAGIMTHYA